MLKDTRSPGVGGQVFSYTLVLVTIRGLRVH